MEFQITLAEEEDYQAIVDTIESVVDSLEEKEWFAADSAEYILQILKEGTGIGFKATEALSGRLAGIFMMVFPGRSEENLGRDIGFPDQELEKVVHMDTVAVLPEFRGHHLQSRLMRAAEEEAARRGYRYLMCTVHPENRYSRENVLKQGYRAVLTKEKYGGYLRDILVKTLDESN